MKTYTTDLEDCDTPESVATVLRNAADKFRESPSELQAAWGDPNAGKVWEKIARSLECEADKIEKLVGRWA